MELLKKKFFGFWNSVAFLTCLPLPSFLFSPQYRGLAIWPLPYIGLAIGAFSGLLFVSLLHLGMFHVFAVILTIAGTLLLTGALHEDGFADFCDGYFGRKDPQKITSIMEDSRIGTFGVLGLILLLYARFTALTLMFEWSFFYMVLVLALAAGLSRLSISLFLDLCFALGGASSGTGNNPGAGLGMTIKKGSSIGLFNKWRGGGHGLSIFIGLQIVWLSLALPTAQTDQWWLLPMLLLFILFLLLIIFSVLHNAKKLPLSGDSLGFLQASSEIIILLFLISYLGLPA